MSIEVHPGGYVRSETDNLAAYDIYTYLALGLRVKLPRGGFAGYLGYFPPEEPTDIYVREMLDEALSEVNSFRDVTAWPAGCAPFDLALPETRAAKEYTTAILAEHKVAIAQALWIPSSSLAISSLNICCPRGTMSFSLQHKRDWKD